MFLPLSEMAWKPRSCVVDFIRRRQESAAPATAAESAQSGQSETGIVNDHP
jgi:hypothetical protein